MLTKSMTGYGKGESEENSQKLVIELKAVNHRFLDLNIKLPRGFTFAEDIIRKLISEKIERGHIDVYVNYEDKRTDKVAVEIDFAIAKTYVDGAKKLAAEFGVANNYCVAEILRTPEIVSQKINEADENLLVRLIKAATANAIDKLNVMRTTEGTALKADILQKVATVDRIVLEVEKLAPQSIEEHKNKLRERITVMLGDVAVDENRLLNEVAFFSDKVCVDEEIARLKGHVVHVKEIFSQGGAMGKQLDFLVQEMNREVNTIGSKCSSLEITNDVLELKSTVEKIREQIQNIQ